MKVDCAGFLQAAPRMDACLLMCFHGGTFTVKSSDSSMEGHQFAQVETLWNQGRPGRKGLRSCCRCVELQIRCQTGERSAGVSRNFYEDRKTACLFSKQLENRILVKTVVLRMGHDANVWKAPYFPDISGNCPTVPRSARADPLDGRGKCSRVRSPLLLEHSAEPQGSRQSEQPEPSQGMGCPAAR